MEERSKSVIQTSAINPVDYFNINHVADMMELMTTVKNVKQTSINSLAYIMNKSDEKKRMIVVNDKGFKAEMDNGLFMRIGELYTPFMMLQKFIFKDNFNSAMHYVMHEFMNIPHDYIRVGTKYYKVIKKVDRFGVTRTQLKIWDKAIIVDDMGRKFLYDIDKYDDFTIVPDNKNYKNIIGNNYNLYAPFEHEPCSEDEYKGDIQWYWTKTLLEHIFGEQYETGLKYFKVLYDMPKQALPILVLISEERQTGKSTLVDYMTILFGDNAVVVNPQDISSSFNSTYADKNIIAIEESRFDNVQATEKLKALSTQKKLSVNTKFVQQYSLPFFGKLIITSNDENKFSKVDNPEIRYWVRKIPSLEGKANHNIHMDLAREIPYFLYHLSTMDEIDVTKSRMVFEAVELETEALRTVKKESLPGLHKDLYLLFDEHCANNTHVEEFKFTAKDIKNKWFNNNSRIEINYINRILKSSMKLDKQQMQRFEPLEEGYNPIKRKVSGRPYVLKNEYYDPNIQQKD
jgi:hypothetical protein